MDIPRFRAILRHQLGWAYAGPVTNQTERYVDRSGADQFAPNLSTFSNEEQVNEFLLYLGCQVETEKQ